MILLAAVFLFAMSAGASYTWRYWRDKDTVAEGTPSGLSSESPQSSAPPEKPALEEPDTESKFDVPVALRPPDVPGAEDVAKLAEDRRTGLEDVARQRKQLKTEKEEMVLIYEDILEQQQEVDELRRQVDEELAEHIKSVKRYLEQMQVTGEPGAELEGIGTSGGEGGGDAATSGIEAKRMLKRMGSEYDTMSPESVAAIFRQLIRGGNIDTVISLFAVMKERQVGNVLEVFKESDPGLAATLTKLRTQATQRSAGPATKKP